MSLTVAEQAAFDAFKQGIDSKQQYQTIDFENDILIFDDPVSKMKKYQEEDLNNDAIMQFDDIDDTAPQSAQQRELTQLPQLTKDSGYNPVKNKRKLIPLTLKKQDFRPSQPTNSRVVGLLNDDQDVGEVGEWMEKKANEKNSDDDDFDVFDIMKSKRNNIPQIKTTLQQDLESQQIEAQRQKINAKLQQKGTALAKRQGPIVNNLKEKAKIIALSNTGQQPQQQDPNVVNNLHNFSDIDGDGSHDDGSHEEDQINHEADRKIFQIRSNSIEKSLSSHRILKEIQSPKLQLDVWEEVNKDRLKEVLTKPIAEGPKKITFIEAWDKLKSNEDLRNSVKLSRQNSTQVGLLHKMFGCFSVHIKSTRLEDEINQIVHLSQNSYDDSSKLHFQIIYTIYCQFMESDYCQRYGNHWEMIGFQGRDPATDLRSTGMFGLLQILAFLGNYKEYIKDCLEYSKNAQLSLCVTLINITLFCTQALKEKRFHDMINKEDSALSVINKVYFSAWYFFFERFKSSGGGFDKIGPAIQIVKVQISANPLKLVTEFNKSIALYYKNREDQI